MFRKKPNYGYYGNYKSNRGRVRKDRLAILIGIVVVIIVAILIALNFTRIRLLQKGYSWSQSSLILKMTKTEEKQILGYDKLDDIVDWVTITKDIESYDEYQKYADLREDVKKEDVVVFMDEVLNDQIPALKKLDYSDKEIWTMLKFASTDDLDYLVDNKLSSSATKEFRAVEGYQIQKMNDYIASYKETKDYNYSVGIVNYPFILSTSQTTGHYELTDPDNVENLVKKGFFLPSTYEPADLVVPKVPIADDTDGRMRQEAATALEEMVAQAKKEGYFLLINSAYRSYDRQKATYEEFETKYGGLYAAEYVATPGASEHQTGLGVDLTSQSVIDGTRLVFGDTAEYKWCLENSYRFGFINRFSDETADITGIAHEPWHFRYIGKDLAKKVYDSKLTYEEYCLYHNIMPEVEAK